MSREVSPFEGAERNISPIPFLLDSSSVQSGPASPSIVTNPPANRSMSPYESRPPLREEWETEGEVMETLHQFGASTPIRHHFLDIPGIEDDERLTPSRDWNSGEGSSRSEIQWLQREAVRRLSMIPPLLPCDSPAGASAGASRATSGANSSAASSPSNARAEASVEGVLRGGVVSPLPLGSVNDENGERSPDGEMEQDGEVDDGTQSDSTASSVHTPHFDSDAGGGHAGRQAASSSSGLVHRRVDENDTLGARRLTFESDGSNEPDPYQMSPTFFEQLGAKQSGRSDLLGSKDGENGPDPDNVGSHGAEFRRQGSATQHRQPRPLVLPTKTRLSITINKWMVAANWQWMAGDETTCGICRMPFEACCIECKTPGDECPLALGSCRHAFHMHCIVKWTETQNTPRPQCPLCRQEWKFAAG